MAEPNFSHLVPEEHNPVTHQKHRRETFWQIIVPLALGVVLLLVACVLPSVVVAQGRDVRVWADISLIWLITPAMLLSLIPLALLVGLVYGMARLMQVVPGFMFRTQRIFNTIRERVGQVADKSVEPILRIHSLNARLQTLVSRDKNKQE